MARTERDGAFRDGEKDILRWRARQGKVAEDSARLPEDDDGRTIVNMNVEGMPWYAPETPDGAPEAARQARVSAPESRLTREETRFFTWGALKAALLVVGVMCLGLVLFVLFCQFVWFRS